MSASTLAAPAPQRHPAGINIPVALGALAILLAGVAAVGQIVSPRQAALYLLGGALGLVLYHAAFGFTSAWRVFIADRRGEGLRAQMVMLAIAVLLFFPVLSAGMLLGQPVQGLVSPVGVSVVAGAFLFGMGMQLGGGCASGTLYTAGGGSTRMVLTLVAFVAGSALGAAHLHWWAALPHLPPISLVQSWGVVPALAVNLAVFALIAGVTVVLERRRHGRLVRAAAAPRAARLWLQHRRLLLRHRLRQPAWLGVDGGRLPGKRPGHPSPPALRAGGGTPAAADRLLSGYSGPRLAAARYALLPGWAMR